VATRTVTTGPETRGQPSALAAVQRFIAGPVPHAILLAGPAAVGKTTLARDLARGLLCRAPEGDVRPCGECRGCRQVGSGNHPDLHQLAPEGPGGQIGIGRVRELAIEMALMPVEGGVRVALIEAAHRLNEDAQNAMLKLLEEPPPGVVIVLCADEEERLLDTVRSRCVRVRLGLVQTRDVERLLGDLGLGDPPTAARLARIAGGRPGLAVAYARAPEAALARAEIARRVLDLLPMGRSARLAAVRDLSSQAAAVLEALERVATDAPPSDPGGRTAGGPARRRARAPMSVATTEDDDGPAVSSRSPASERRRAAAWLVEVWRDVLRDLALVQAGTLTLVRDTGLLDDLVAIAPQLSPETIGAFVVEIDAALERLDASVSPELLLDALVLAAPRPGVVA